MRPVITFQAQPRHFWAHVKLLSEGLGYSAKGKIKRYTLSDLGNFLTQYGLATDHLDVLATNDTTYGALVIAYINYRADILEQAVMPNLMNRDQARTEFEQLRTTFQGTIPLSYNKQSDEKRHPAYPHFHHKSFDRVYAFKSQF